MKNFFSLVVLLPFLFLTACNKSGGDNHAPVANTNGISNGVVNTAAGTYVMAGTIITINPSCQANNVATITVSNSSGGYGTGAVIYTVQLNVGGTFSTPAIPAGTYNLRATAGTCSVQGNLQAITNGQSAFNICLGANCSCNSYSCIVSKAGTPFESAIASALPGSGDLKIDSANIYFSATKPLSLDLSVEATSGNNLLGTTPVATSGKWQGSVGTDGSVKIGADSVGALSYSAQVDSKLLQFEQGFCGTAGVAGQKASDYAKQSGFSSKAVIGLEESFGKIAQENICIYPQDSSVINRAISLKTDSKLQINRLWFVVVKESELVAKLKNISRPKSDAVAAAKKVPGNRKIASDNDGLAEELALGFVVKK